MYKLSSENVENVFADCLGETAGGENTITCEGVAHSFLFMKDKLKDNAEKIYEMLLQLPEQFQKDSGGGYSFLCACNDKDGNQWTGLHLNMEKLFALGIGIEKVKCLLPREMWSVLPGGVPYYVVL